MSALVLAGAAQLVAVELWEAPLPVVAIVATTLVVDLRYLLMGASLRPWFEELSVPRAYGSVLLHHRRELGALDSRSPGGAPAAAGSSSAPAWPSGCCG
jgi:hypothetical protein